MYDKARYPFGILQKICKVVSEELKRLENGAVCVHCGKRADGQSRYCSESCNKQHLYRKKTGIKWHP